MGLSRELRQNGGDWELTDGFCYQIGTFGDVPFIWLQDEGCGLAWKTLFGNLGLTEVRRVAVISPATRFSAPALTAVRQHENLSSLFVSLCIVYFVAIVFITLSSSWDMVSHENPPTVHIEL
jgi:hypothetical protein